MAAIYAAAFDDSRPWSCDEIRTLLGARGVFSATTAAGFALGRIIADEVELLTIAVHPTAQCSGQGRALLTAIETTAIAKGGETLFLEVAEDNAAAIRLYTRARYVPNGRRKGYYRHGDRVVDAVLMSKSLCPAPLAAF